MLVYFFVGFVSAHFADGILQHRILLVKVVNGFLAHSEVVHWCFEEEAQETLNAMSASTCSKVAQQTKVKA